MTLGRFDRADGISLSEYTEEDRELKQLDETTFEVSGMISLDELETALDVELPVEDYETLNGFLISLFGNIPPQDEVNEVRYKHLFINVIDVTEKRIEKVIIKIEDPTQIPGSEE